ncbi:MAG: hypothetical protein Q4D98_11840 [Planctomycetia bacterium]|nr:hypothetical protein [Planctomycetia bacterium]
MSESENDPPVLLGDILRSMVSFFVPGRGYIATGVVIVLLFFAGLVVLWKTVEVPLLSHDRYLLTQDKIELKQCLADGKIQSGQPPWITRDLVPEVLELVARQQHRSANEPFSILDPKLVEMFKMALQMHPWVRRVVSVTKKSPAQLEMVVEYRRPVLVVEVAPEDADTITFYPVDADAKILPLPDFPLSELGKYPHLTDYPYPPLGTTPGSCWPTGNAVEDAVRIVCDFGDYWNQLGMKSLRVYRERDDETLSSENHFILYTHNDSTIRWGACFREGISGREVYTNEAKIQKIIQYVNQRGRIDVPGTERVHLVLQSKNATGTVSESPF